MTDWDIHPNTRDMKMKLIYQIFMMISLASIVVLAGMSFEDAFAHGGQLFEFNLPNSHTDNPLRMITVIIGHSNEPTSAYEWGKSTGYHPMELYLRDTFTGLNLAHADLTADKYYYKNSKEFNKAVINGFEPIESNVPVKAVHGEPGHYVVRQILAYPGIYGYHVTGTVSYFGVIDVPIDVKAFCRNAPENEFTTLTFGGFGCTSDIDDNRFPKRR